MIMAKFDYIIGNPPYQVSDGGNNASATPVYNKMIEEALKLQPENLMMIIPDRWFSGGRGLDKFRETMINDGRISLIVDYLNADECFPGMDISAGICYFLWDKNHTGDCKVINVQNGIESESIRPLNEFPILVRSNSAIPILDKVKDKTKTSLSEFVSSQKPFGLRTYAKPENHGDLTLRWNKGRGPISSKNVPSGTELINKWNVIVSRVFYEHAGKTDKNGQCRVLSILEILEPKVVCSETYVVVKSFDTEQEANNLMNYLKTKFARYLIMQATSSIMITKQSFQFVPDLDFTKEWDDQKLYKEFKLTSSDIAEIESKIKEME